MHSDLDILLSSARDQKSLEDQLQWLVRLLHWVRFSRELQAGAEGEREAGPSPVLRLRYLLMILERNPDWKLETARILRRVVKDVSGLELFTETGLPKELGLLGELWDRLVMKLLPTPPLDQELGFLLWALFPEERDPVWVAEIDSVTFQKLIDLFNYDVSPAEGEWNRLARDMEDALIYLMIQIRAIGLSPAFRHRLEGVDFRDSAFFGLIKAQGDFQAALDSADQRKCFEAASALRRTIEACHQELQLVYKHLDEYGVSVNLVFQIARLQAYIRRSQTLMEVLVADRLEAKKVTGLLAMLILENQELRSMRRLLSQNISLLARKVVERAAETGEHYITRTREEYQHMVQAAAGGGAITAFTVYVKMGILALGLSGFMEGLFASLNYAVSFCAIHLAGFTLGTKQPAMTAPALAEKMNDVDSETGMDSLVDEITHLIRSQVAAITGNILLVIPCTFLIDLLFNSIAGHHIMSYETAHHAFEATDVLGPALLYAAFTGVLLWLSSLAAGWGDNWFALYSLRKTLARSPTLRAVLGKTNARRVAMFFEQNISGLLGNIVLGVLLGLVPAILHFIGVPLEVRHVTLSSGAFGGALPVLGLDYMKTAEFWRAVIGVILIGVVNVLVSFSLALGVAIRARNINTPQRRAIRKAVLKRLWKRPLSFLFPAR